MWGALQGNSLIRTFRVGIRCSSLKMRKKSTLRAVLCGWCHLLLFIESSCNIQSLTMTRRVSQVPETCGNHKGFHQRQMDFLCTRFGKWLFQRMEEEEHHLKSWKQRAVREMPLIISAVWYRRRSFSTALPLPPPAETSLISEMPFAFHVCSAMRWARVACRRPDCQRESKVQWSALVTYQISTWNGDNYQTFGQTEGVGEFGWFLNFN